ncbi:hypothetical protein AEAC466_19260 [Asticcacaulis sp. AC466]|uniref:hypothetical protein n=1 Tax=Asticcacaulis sp. AC466 TaxID=1282362 RepID=UPI0003C3E7E1|nr:hypothetical protein [Asticcacaulis sp. AC466]ESQ82059.1 hypothetical protein AEAC466_19260 [Asticcacaulis sp. AC466]
MKTLLITAAVAALSVTAAHAADPYAALDAMAPFMAATNHCEDFDYAVDLDATTAEVMRRAQAVAAGGVDQSAILPHFRATMQTATDKAEAAGTLGALRQLDAKPQYEGIEKLFGYWSPICSRYAASPEFASLITAPAYAKSGQPQSYFGLIEFKAAHGDVSAMKNAASMYDNGFRPDPNNGKAHAWWLKAAEAGDATAADAVASDFFTAHGAPKNYVEAVKWAAISAARGGDGKTLKTLEEVIPAADLSKGKAAAQAWLAQHK